MEQAHSGTCPEGDEMWLGWRCNQLPAWPDGRMLLHDSRYWL